ncbi:MAG: ImmA/IrrE family metallo-endopeptidase [Candidatus Pseudobacter hemicellulosilyticus]|uniref:ImmA/IrrE family metallo-endopeptidase n=1 Tax=Candidatus Pseudobacter hemicellulosilyticus TaxID=3121375 RepID=A0AAJ6BF26_9BACT|nr:MAG: ImmA/IrrE family metallo-endopeptidase [Pseudobacter sp.]
MPSKSVLPRGFKAEAERLAEQCRADIGVSKFSPLDAHELARYLGIQIFTVDELFADQTCTAYLKMSDPKEFSAMWTPNKAGELLIIHNDKHSPFRQQSNLMHELAHIIRKHNVPDEKARLCAQFGLHYYNLLHEQEAKHLGGCLQITRAGLQWALKNAMEDEDISKYYNASVDMVKYRIGVTGVKKQFGHSRS